MCASRQGRLPKRVSETVVRPRLPLFGDSTGASAPNLSRRLPLAGVAAWILSAAAGTAVVWNHSLAPGADAVPPDRWPRESSVVRSPRLPTLLLFVHPRCPCTRATLGEFAVLMAQSGGRVSTRVLCLLPDGAPADWADTDLLRTARAMPGVDVLLDRGGVEARRFGAATSGQALLYDAEGRLVFSGGITASRGHSGDNAGRAAVLAFLRGEAPDRRHTLVFGCRLFGPSDVPQRRTCPCPP